MPIGDKAHPTYANAESEAVLAVASGFVSHSHVRRSVLAVYTSGGGNPSGTVRGLGVVGGAW